MGFLEKLQSRFELYKLEKRYTRRNRRTTFISDATYVDGEYVYNGARSSTPSARPGSFRVPTMSTGSSRSNSSVSR